MPDVVKIIKSGRLNKVPTVTTNKVVAVTNGGITEGTNLSGIWPKLKMATNGFGGSKRKGVQVPRCPQMQAKREAIGYLQCVSIIR